MAHPNLLVSREGAYCTVTLNRPDKRNALSLDLMLELTDTLRGIGEGDALGVILAANGPVFSAGHNFADMAGSSRQQVRELFSVCTTMMNTLQAIGQPVVARVHGLATAAGCQLVASCDLAVACEAAQFAIPGGKAALFCHTPLVAVARNIGRKRALEMAMTGDSIDAASAAQWGLINTVVPAAQLESATLDLLRRATRGTARSKALGKQAYYRQIELPQEQAYVFAGDVMADGAMDDDAQEGFHAFMEKRPARFGKS